ncbi:MAG: amidohydrolase [Pirellulales bacterium]|nr:amidohydrolase [Pirellulales bacterium]
MNARIIAGGRTAAKTGAAVLLLTASSVTLASEPTPAEWLKANLPPLVQLYKSLHQSPELSFEEEQTAAGMASELREIGLEVTERVGGHGVVGVLSSGPGPTLMLRADMDALPVVEQTGLDYASQTTVRDARGATVGVMHACGHDMHMTMLLGTLEFLAEHKEGWHGTVVAVFQPAEERGAGARAMLDDGLFARFPRPDFALALHVAADRPTGQIAWRTGYAMANVDSVDVTIKGKGGHGAYPHMTIDPVVIAARLVLDLQTIVSREVRPIDPAVVTVGAIHGGAKHNVISDECKLQITVRSYTPEVREQILAAIRRKALAAADSAGAPEPEVSVSDGTPALANDEKLARRVDPAIRRVLGEKNLVESEPSMGGEDFGAFGRAGVPILMMSVGAVNQERLDRYQRESGGAPSLHSPLFYPDIEPTLTTGVTALTAASLELLQPRR